MTGVHTPVLDGIVQEAEAYFRARPGLREGIEVTFVDLRDAARAVIGELESGRFIAALAELASWDELFRLNDDVDIEDPFTGKAALQEVLAAPITIRLEQDSGLTAIAKQRHREAARLEMSLAGSAPAV